MNFKWFKSVLIFSTGSLIAVLLLTSQGQSAIRAVYGLAVAQSSTAWNSIRDSSQGDTLLNGLPATGLYRFNGVSWDRERHSFTQTVTGITAASTGANLDLSTTPKVNHTIQILRTAGSTDVVSIPLQCSLDGVNFFQIGIVTNLSTAVFAFATTSCDFIRYDVVTVGAGNTLTIFLLSS